MLADKQIRTYPFKIESIAKCPRCGRSHYGLSAHAFNEIPSGVCLDESQITHYSSCPGTGEPILISVLNHTQEAIEEKRATETARLREIVNRLPHAWRYDEDGDPVQDVPMIPGIGEHRWIACEDHDLRWVKRPKPASGVYEAEILKRRGDRGRTEMCVWQINFTCSPVNWWSGPIWATKEDAERALAEMQASTQKGARDE